VFSIKNFTPSYTKIKILYISPAAKVTQHKAHTLHIEDEIRFLYLKKARFADVAAVQERVTAVLRSNPKEAFADSFQKLYELCQQCVVKDGDYFEIQ
jgi:hypothetical protein